VADPKGAVTAAKVGISAQIVVYLIVTFTNNVWPHFLHDFSDKIFGKPTRPIIIVPWPLIMVLPVLYVGLMLLLTPAGESSQAD
jgi:uncharacterized membrane protein